MSVTAHAISRRIEHRFPDQRRGAPFAENLDREFRARRSRLDRHESERDALFTVVGEAARSHEAHDVVAREYRLVGPCVRVTRIDHEGVQSAVRRRLAFPHRGVTPHEVVLSEVDESIEAGLRRGVLGAVLAHPGSE